MLSHDGDTFNSSSVQNRIIWIEWPHIYITILIFWSILVKPQKRNIGSNLFVPFNILNKDLSASAAASKRGSPTILHMKINFFITRSTNQLVEKSCITFSVALEELCLKACVANWRRGLVTIRFFFSSQPFVETSKDCIDQFTDHRTVGVNWTALACWPSSEQRTNKNNTPCSVFMSLPEEIQQLFYWASVFHGLMYHKMRSDPSNLIFWLLLLYTGAPVLHCLIVYFWDKSQSKLAESWTNAANSPVYVLSWRWTTWPKTWSQFIFLHLINIDIYHNI